MILKNCCICLIIITHNLTQTKQHKYTNTCIMLVVNIGYSLARWNGSIHIKVSFENETFQPLTVIQQIQFAFDRCSLNSNYLLSWNYCCFSKRIFLINFFAKLSYVIRMDMCFVEQWNVRSSNKLCPLCFTLLFLINQVVFFIVRVSVKCAVVTIYWRDHKLENWIYIVYTSMNTNDDYFC